MKFIPPKLDEIQAYAKERNSPIDPEEFLSFYEANGWVQGDRGKPIRDWRAAFITWERRYKQRLNGSSSKPKSSEGYQVKQGVRR